MRLIAPICLAAAFLASTAHAQSPDAAPIVAAERAFAADFPALGLVGSFSKWSEPGAILISGGRAATSAELFGDGPRVRQDGEPLIAWWPTFAGIALSGDLGFTTGPAAQDGQGYGHYFTVWRRQPDGRWLWVYDGGSGASPTGQPGPDSEPVLMTPATAAAGSAAAAMVEVRATETALALAALADQRAAHLNAMAPDGRLYVAPLSPAIGREAIGLALSGWPDSFSFGHTEGGGASEAGDLAWTYGPATWLREGQPRRGHYVRLWRKDREGWRIVLAQLIAAPPPQAG